MPRVLTQEQKDKMADGRRRAAQERKEKKIASGELNPDGTKRKTEKPKRILSEEQKAKMADGRRRAAEERKKTSESGDDKTDTTKGSKKTRKPRLTKNALLAVKAQVELDIASAPKIRSLLTEEEALESSICMERILKYLNSRIGIMEDKEKEKEAKEENKEEEDADVNEDDIESDSDEE